MKMHTSTLPNYFNKSNHYDIHEARMFIERYELLVDHPAIEPIIKLLNHLIIFLNESNSDWNQTRSKERMLKFINEMAVAFETFNDQNQLMKKNFIDSENTLLSALLFCKKTLLKQLEAFASQRHQNPMYLVYLETNNSLKKLLNE